MDQRTGVAATLSILAAIGSYIVVCAGHPGWGLLLAVVSVPLGLVGLIMAASPRVSGGIMSIVAMVLGVIGIVFALLGVIGVAVF